MWEQRRTATRPEDTHFLLAEGHLGQSFSVFQIGSRFFTQHTDPPPAVRASLFASQKENVMNQVRGGASSPHSALALLARALTENHRDAAERALTLTDSDGEKLGNASHKQEFLHSHSSKVG